MSTRDATQNLILLKDAEKRGHLFPRLGNERITGFMECFHCGKTLWLLCEEAKEYVADGKDIPKCTDRR